MTETLPTLPTSVVGSHGLPGWVWLAREALEAGRMGATDVRELMEDATQIALLDQERAGIDVVSTGEMMRVRFIIGFYDRIQGIRSLPPPRRLGQPLWDTNTPFEVAEKISAPQGLGIVDEFKLARELTGKRIKATVPGPYTLLVPLKQRMAGNLSGGEQQMLTIARTLMGNPSGLLLDEPSEGLAPVIVERIGALLRQLRDMGVTVLLAEQNMHFCLDIASHAVVIDKGQVVYRDTIEALRHDEAVKSRYLAL